MKEPSMLTFKTPYQKDFKRWSLRFEASLQHVDVQQGHRKGIWHSSWNNSPCSWSKMTHNLTATNTSKLFKQQNDSTQWYPIHSYPILSYLRLIGIIMTSTNPILASNIVKLYPPSESIQIKTYHITAPIHIKHGCLTLSLLNKIVTT